MGHYLSEMYEETQDDRDQERAQKLVASLRKLPSSRFTVDELSFLMRRIKTRYYPSEIPKIIALAEREGIR